MSPSNPAAARPPIELLPAHSLLSRTLPFPACFRHSVSLRHCTYLIVRGRCVSQSGFVLTGLDVDDDLAFLAALTLQRRGEGRVSVEDVTLCGGNAPLKHVVMAARRLHRASGGQASQSCRTKPPLPPPSSFPFP